MPDLQALYESSPFDRLFGLAMERTDRGVRLRGSLPAVAAVTTGSESAHGGAVATLLDTAATFALIADGGDDWVTVDLRIDFLRPTPIGRVEVEGERLRAGRALGTARATLLDGNGRTCATATGTFARVRPSRTVGVAERTAAAGAEHARSSGTRPAGGDRLRIDHVLFAVQDLLAASARLRAEHGLGSATGGRHPGLGTENRIVPLGDAYLELIQVVDPDEAARDPLGRLLLERSTGGDRLAAWSVATDDLDGVAARLGLGVEHGSRRSASGSELRWRLAGVDEAAANPARPFFISWAGTGADHHPSRVAVEHATAVGGISWIEVAGEQDALIAWLGAQGVPLRVRPGPPAVLHVGLAGPGPALVL